MKYPSIFYYKLAETQSYEKPSPPPHRHQKKLVLSNGEE